MLEGVAPGAAVECDVGAIGTPDRVALDALARLQLVARRLGHQVQLRDASPQLRELLRRAGLCDAVPLVDEGGADVGPGDVPGRSVS